MTQDMVKALSDGELVRVIDWAQGEQSARNEQRKRETIKQIKQLALNAGVYVSIDRKRRRLSNNETAK